MWFGVRVRAALRGSGRLHGAVAGSPSIDPSVSTSGHLWPAEIDSDPQYGFREIDCVRRRLSAAVIAAAEQRAARLGTGADRVLIAAGALDEETYLRAMGDASGVPFEPLDGIPRTQCPLDDDRLIEAAAIGLLPLAIGDAIVFVVAPRGVAARKILAMIENTPATAARFRFTTNERFNRFVLRGAGERIAANASDALKLKWPALSAASPYRLGNIVTLTPIALSIAAAVAFAPNVTAHGVEILLAAIFVAWLALRITGALVQRPVAPIIPPRRDDTLPIYTIICALYQEASSVNGLLSAIERLDYPHEKLDVILAVEADDRETRAAIGARKTRIPITVIPVPNRGPRTKPKALNVALPFARGAFTVVYDAEDRPEPDQLRCALQAFDAGGDDIACVQARLCIDNTADSLIARYFTAEYAGQFDVFLPGLTAMRLPLPLGGSSNHFHTATLRKIGGWDAYNVTEDADLGMRLARFGYRADIIQSTTYEEAPAHAGPWLRQRTRWFKGWMQTWLVHMRRPGRLLIELGLPGFLAFQLMVGGNALAALVHPLFLAGLIYALASGSEILHGDTAAFAILGALYGTTAIIGYLSSAFIGLLGLMRRGLASSAWVLLLTPIHWLMLSLAAWRALYQLLFAPYRWEKTAHGLAKTSHRATKMTRALLALEREVDGLKKRGELPAIGERAAKAPPLGRRSHGLNRRWD
jgi:cellulose synthase/poly-beta-1,6-N-acetylglucosamine synthase-like glycosyltransferase